MFCNIISNLEMEEITSLSLHFISEVIIYTFFFVQFSETLLFYNSRGEDVVMCSFFVFRSYQDSSFALE